MYVVGLRDRSSIVVDGLVAPTADPGEPEPGTLGASHEAMAWVGDAVAAGVTFDVLKEVAARLVRSGWSRRTRAVDAACVTSTVRDYLQSTGYMTIVFNEVRKVAEAGWSLTGTADGASFRALADPHGEVTHVRVT